MIRWKVLDMSAEDWLRAAKAEEQRLLVEIMKTDLYRQLEVVRAVLAVYQGKAPAQTIVTAAERGSKTNVLNAA
jgi:hypothetical protein